MVNYSPPPIEGNYSVTYNEDQGGMEVIYDITNVFLDAVLKGDMFPEGFLSTENFPDLDSVTDKFPDLAIESIQDIVVQNAGVLACIVLGPLFAVATLLCGCCFCCCCGNKKNRNSSGGSGLKSALLSVLLFLLIIITSIGCVWFFLGSKSTANGLDNFPEEFDDVLHDGELYINQTVAELKHLLGPNLDETIDEFYGELDDVAEGFDKLLNNFTKETHFDDIKDTANQFIKLVESYNDVSDNLTYAGNNVTSIKGNLTSIKDLINDQAICDALVELCSSIGAVISDAETIINGINLPQVPPVSNTQQLTEIQSILLEVEKGLNNINITAFFKDVTPQIDEIKKELQDQIDAIVGPIEEDVGSIFRGSGTKDILDLMKDIRDNYFPYFNIATLVLGSFFAAILVIFFLGMCCGSCSKQGGKAASGAATLLFSTNVILILLAILLFILCTVLFTVGALSQKLVCNNMEEPKNSELLTFVSPLLSQQMGDVLGNSSVSYDLGQILQGLKDHNTTTLYPLLQLSYIYDIGALRHWRETYGIDDLIENAKKEFTETLGEFYDYKETFDGIRVDVNGIGGMVDGAITGITGFINVTDDLTNNLNSIKGNMSGFSDSIPDSTPGSLELKASFDNISDSIEDIIQIIEGIRNLFDTVIIEILGEETMTEKITFVFKNIDTAFSFLEPDGEIEKFFDTSVNSILKVVEDYVKYAVNEAENEVGKTGPISDIYNAVFTDVCLEIVYPFNAVWSGLGWCLLLLLLPVTLVLNSLRKIYLTDEQQPGLRQSYGNASKPPMNRAVSYNEMPMSQYGASAPPNQPPGYQKYNVPDKYRGQR